VRPFFSKDDYQNWVNALGALGDNRQQVIN
jgi:hypothetical protein